MSRKGENIYKRKDGRWEGRYIKARTENGKPIYGYVYAHSYHEVRQKRIDALQSVQMISSSLQDNHTPSDAILFSEVANLWMNNIKAQVKTSTYIKYSNSLKNYILPHYSKIDIGEITYSSLEAFTSNLLVSGGVNNHGLSSKTVADTIAIIREIVFYGYKHGYNVNYISKGIMINTSRTDFTIFTREEQAHLQEYLLQNMNNKNLGILICLYTGIRVGELCALRWDDISLSEQQISIHRTMQRIQCECGSVSKTKIIETTPKSRCSSRKIPIPYHLLNLIVKDFQHHSGYLLTSHETKFIEPRSMQNHFKKVLKTCQIRELKFHTLRHTFATRCVELDFDVKTLSEILGHASVNITMDRYVHPSMELKREHMNKLSDLFTVK